MNDYEASTAAPEPAHRYDRRDPDGRRYMAAVLGEPVPTTHVSAIACADAFNAAFRQDNLDALRGMKSMIERMAAEDEVRS